MAERLRPTPEAIERIRLLGEKPIISFLDDVSAPSLRSVIDFLPTVHGFRKHSEEGIKRQKQALARKLTSKTGGDDRDHRALYVMWRSWAWERLGDPENIEHLIDELEGTESGSNDADQKRLAGISALFTALRNLSLENKCTREKIARFFEFSPFSPSPAIQELIQTSKAAADVDRDAALSSLPKRLQHDEEEIQAIRTKLKSVSNDVQSVVSELAQTDIKISDLRSAARAAKDGAEQRGAVLDKALNSIKDLTNGLAKVVREIDDIRRNSQTQLADAEDDRAQSEKHLSSIQTQLMEAISDAVEPLKQKLAGVVPASAEALESVAKEVDRLAGQITTLVEGASLKDDLRGISERIDALEKRTERPLWNARDHADEALPHATLANGHGAPDWLTPIRIASPTAAKPITLDSVAKIVGGLASGLQSLGLKKSAAEAFAQDITSSIITGQVTFFKGALGSAVARLCARSICLNQSWLVSVPIGMTDGIKLRGALDALTENSGNVVISVVLEGINRSSLDTLRDVLAEFSTDQAPSQHFRMILFANLVQGVAALPVEPEYLEFGPVFDLDHLEWRSRPDFGIGIVHGVLPFETERSLRKSIHSAAFDPEDVLRLLARFMKKRNVRIERIACSAFGALQQVAGSRAEPSVMQSLAFGWLVPLWLAIGVSREDADSELDGGKYDSPKGKIDSRIASIFAAGEFAPARSGDRG